MSPITIISASVFLLTALFAIYKVYSAGKTSERETQESNVIKIKKAQDRADSLPPSSPDDIINKLRDGDL